MKTWSSAQTHLAMIRFHNRVVNHIAPTTPSADLFKRASWSSSTTNG
ncbi:hypothetical protein LP415_13390 [Polaromonas sp. P1(28)-8]|nr:hypothetical protein LP415_13390 [Polaromonas sp. P1(28)-8]